MRHPDMPFADERTITYVKDESRQILERWQDGHEPAMTLRVWLSTTNRASARLEWGKNASVGDEALALTSAQMIINELLIALKELALSLTDAGGERGES